MAAARLKAMDGLVDWYWLGVVVGLGVATGAAFLRGPTVYALASLVALVAAVVIVVLALPAWAFGAAGGSAAVGWLSLRRLAVAAVPAAFLALAIAAFVPALGYVEALVSPVLAGRLRQRAAGRYAGLRVLAKD
jgi:hypothetical protein